MALRRSVRGPGAMIPWTAIADLLAMQRPNGTWPGDQRGGAHLTALTLLVEDRFGVLTRRDRVDGLRWLLHKQADDGGFPWGPDPGRSDVSATTCVRAGILATTRGADEEGLAIRRMDAFLALHGGPAVHDPVLQGILVGTGRLGGGRPPPAASLGGAGWPGALRRATLPALFAAQGSGVSRRQARAADRYLGDRQDPSGGWGGELLTTLLGALTLQAAGATSDDTRVGKALDHVAVWKRQTDHGLEVLAGSADVRNTADALRLLCDNGLANPPDHRLLAGVDWILDQQADGPPATDWVAVEDGGSGRGGGWAAGSHNARRPDCVSTGAVLAAFGALSEAAQPPARVRRAMRRGATWLLSMQHASGGWSTYGASPSEAGVTAQALAGLGRCGYRAGDPPVDRAVRRLRERRTSPRGEEALLAVGLRAPTPSPRPGAARHPERRDETADRIRAIVRREAEDGRPTVGIDDRLRIPAERTGE